MGPIPQRVLNLSQAGASVVDMAHATCCSRPRVGTCSWACCYGSPPPTSIETTIQEVRAHDHSPRQVGSHGD